MRNPKKVNAKKMIEYFNQKSIDNETLNTLFYYSLFDSSSFEADDAIPANMLKENREKTKSILKRVFDKKQYPVIHSIMKNSESYNEFEKNVIGSDLLSRIILWKQLRNLGLSVKIGGDYDLVIKDKAKIELKRICFWTNYCSYLEDFLKKIRNGDKFVYVVACAQPFDIDKLIRDVKNREFFNGYIDKIVRSHYVAETLINRENIKFIIRHIDKSGRAHNNVLSLAGEIKSKVCGDVK